MLNFSIEYCNDFCDNKECQLNFFCRLNYNEDSFIVIYRIWLIFKIFPFEWFLLKEDLTIPKDIERLIVILFLNERYSEVSDQIFFEYIGHCSIEDCHDLSYYYNIGNIIYDFEDYGAKCDECGKCACETCYKYVGKEDTIHYTGFYCITCYSNNNGPDFECCENVD